MSGEQQRQRMPGDDMDVDGFPRAVIQSSLILRTCVSRDPDLFDDRTQTKYDQLLNAATSFCSSFASKEPPKTIFSHFSSSTSVLAYEHGLPQLAPFLGRTFCGSRGIREYFDLLGKHLSYENMRFSNYLVDTRQRKVSVRGEAQFTWTSTGQGWDEVFTYVLEFDEELKVKVYEVWADSGAAYLASRGELKD